MNRPNPIPGCPPGLEFLMTLDEIQVQQLPSLLEGILVSFKNDYL
jgi:hypothetical protein